MEHKTDKKMNRMNLRKKAVRLTVVSMIYAMPALCAYGQDVSETAEVTAAPEPVETIETSEAAATVVSAVSDVSELETMLAFEEFNFYDAAFTQTGAPAYRRKSPFLAWFLSWLYPGIGQFYNGQAGKGIAMTAVATGGFGLCIAAVQKEDDNLGAIGALVLTGVALWSMIDAPVSAGKINRRNTALTWDVGNGAQLNLRPTLSYENPLKGVQSGRELRSGLSLRVDF
jgi:hypothetical protein